MKWILLALILLTATPAVAETEYIFYWEDSVGDDHGPGHYTYPTHKHFAPYEGLWDLQLFRVIKGIDEYIFCFTFGTLTDPWDSFFGFSHPLIHVYIDNAEGGELKPLEPLDKMRMDPRAPWNRALVISGWWVVGLQEWQEWKSPEREVFWELPRPPSLEGTWVEVKGQDIKVAVPRDWLGSLRGARFYVLVGAYDSLQATHFRPVQEVPTQWQFGGANPQGVNHPVLDMLVPTGFNQEDILSMHNPLLMPVGPAKEPINVIFYVLAPPVLLIISVAVFFIYRHKKYRKMTD